MNIMNIIKNNHDKMDIKQNYSRLIPDNAVWEGGSWTDSWRSNNILFLPNPPDLLFSSYVSFFHEWTQECKANSPTWKHQWIPLIIHLQDLLFTHLFHPFTRRHHRHPVPPLPLLSLPMTTFARSLSPHKQIPASCAAPRPVGLRVCAWCSVACNVQKHR